MNGLPDPVIARTTRLSIRPWRAEEAPRLLDILSRVEVARGYASEAAAAVLQRGFDGGLPEILALTHLDNWPSQGVARKIGMEPVGVLERWYDGPSQGFRAVPPAG